MMILGILVGGALGALSRYGVSVALNAWTASGPYASFPLGTLVVNVVGSFLLSFLANAGLATLLPPAVRVAIGTGFLGAMTTFSTLELETDTLLRGGEAGRAALYLLATLVLGYLAILLGRVAAAQLAVQR
ncbi:MAG: fluoride efflux transporter CrcB [Trueperaceae bacterium]